MPDATARTAGGLAPSLEEVRSIAQEGRYRRVPVMRELFADRLTTVEAMRAMRAVSNHVFMLESAEAQERWGRYSFLGCNPSLELSCVDGILRIRRNVEAALGDDADGQDAAATVVETVERVDHPGDAIRAVLADYASPRLEGFPPFCGGLVGYFAYDYLKYAEPTLVRDDLAHEDFRDVDLMLFDTVVAFDAYRQKIAIITGVSLDGDLEAEYARAAARLDRLAEVLLRGERMAFKPLRLLGEPVLAFDEERFCDMVRAVQHHIREGDVFQVVVSNPTTAPATGSLFDAYRVLRCTNPSPYMFYFTSDDVEIAGASPETLARLEDGRLFTFPLAGTRPRGATTEEDAELERDLLADAKELAEHNMLVDLGRNDIGRAAALGSVRVDSYLDVLRFSHVMHIGSTVSGTLAPGRDAVDAIDSILPAGTLSGAPKIRACQIIADLEGAKRGIYGGAVGYLDLAGNMDTCIGIRLAYKKNGVVCVQSGAGIVADSVPAAEFAECANKARAVVEALRAAEGGLDA